jgi:eukaryotic-like serine/threonine-protein kinase
MKKFGAYEILHELSEGGMGSVLLARRKGPGSFEQLVAVKTIRSEYAGAEAVRAMFLDEAAILARLNHPAVATVHDFGEEAGTLYMVMEYVAGVSMRGMIGQMPPGVAARAIAEACRGLHAAHELRDLAGNLLGLVHRDISPDNIMLGFDGHVKVIDFGIALVKNRQAPVTEFGTVKGKPPYMSPEQVKNGAMDRRSDVWALGVVLHELLTGAPLFDGDSIYAIARAVEHQDIVPPSRVMQRELPLGLDASVMNALDRDPLYRTPSAAALAESLEQVINIAGDETLEAWADRELAGPRDAHRKWLASVVRGQDTAPRQLGRPTASVTALGDAPPPVATDIVPPRRSHTLAIILALIVLAMIAGGIVLLTRKREPTIAIDAPIAIVTRDVAPDAAPDATPEPDAAVPDAAVPDAQAKRGPDAGARTVERDAPRAIDAAPPPPAEGFGLMTAKHPGDTYLNVVVDGKFLGVTPMFKKKLAAGHHVIELVTADTNAVVVRREITVVDGQAFTIQP